MTNPAFTRAAASVLAKLGEDAVLRGETVDPPRKAHIAHDVQMIDGQGTVSVVSNMATLMNRDMPAKGDTLLHEGVQYVLDAPIDSNGATTRFPAIKI